MASINRASNSGGGLPSTAESTELADLIQLTDLELRQLTQDQAPKPSAERPAGNSDVPQVTGRRAAVQVGGMAQQYALNSMLNAKNAGAQSGTELSVDKEDSPPPTDNENQLAADQVLDEIKSNLPKMTNLATTEKP